MSRFLTVSVSLFFFLCLPTCSLADDGAPEAGLADRPVAAERSAPGELMPVYGLRFGTGAGSTYVRVLGASSDGPVVLPVKSDQLEALQIAWRDVESSLDGELDLIVSAVVNPLDIRPIGSYRLTPFAETTTVAMIELAAWGLTGWTVESGIFRIPGQDNCCECGQLVCCPDAGKCLGCGRCGQCCLGKSPV